MVGSGYPRKSYKSEIDLRNRYVDMYIEIEF